MIESKNTFLKNILNSFKSIPLEVNLKNFEKVTKIYTDDNECEENINGITFEYIFNNKESKYAFYTRLSIIPRYFFWIDFSSYFLKVTIKERNLRGYSDTFVDTIYYNSFEDSSCRKDIKSIYKFVKNRLEEIKKSKIDVKFGEYNSMIKPYIDKSLTRDDKLNDILKIKEKE